MQQFEGKSKKSFSDSKRHFTVVMDNKEHGLYVSSTPSSAAKKAVTKLCGANKSKKVEFHIREITQGSKKKTYGPYTGQIQKLKEPIELKGRVIQYKPVAKLSDKSSTKKRGMIGGGYNSELAINKNIDYILFDSKSNTDTSIVFTITNIVTREVIEYRNNKFLGQGTYGKVFLVENAAKQKYVIKITNRHQDIFIKEPIMLDIFMNEIGYGCHYKAISQGITIIQGVNIGHIIFPFKGELSFYDIITNKDHYDSYKNFFPNILRDVIICLKEINNFAIHGDIKLDNIVIEKSTKNSFIIDFGLATLFPISIDLLQNLNVGNRQISIEIIIGYLVKIQNNRNKDIFDNLYKRYLEIIEKTIDNFGLFWIIMESIFDINIFEKYFPEQKFLVRLYSNSDIYLLNNYLNFYFNLDYQDLSKCNKYTSLYLKLTDLFEYKGSATFRQSFIDYIFSRLDANKFNMYFNNDKDFFDRFIIKILGLVKVDPRERTTKEELLMDPFFSLLPPQYYAPPIGPPPKNVSSFTPRYAPPIGPPPQNVSSFTPRYAPPNYPPPQNVLNKLSKL
jgi:serine/threonine protein kinase